MFLRLRSVLDLEKHRKSKCFDFLCFCVYINKFRVEKFMRSNENKNRFFLNIYTCF